MPGLRLLEVQLAGRGEVRDEEVCTSWRFSVAADVTSLFRAREILRNKSQF
jgi:hypothetical protein